MNIHSLSYKQAESLELVIKAAKLWISFSLYTQPIRVVFDRIFIRPDFFAFGLYRARAVSYFGITLSPALE